MKKTTFNLASLLVLLAFQINAFSQTLPIVGTLLPGQTKNVISTGLTDSQPLTIANTSAVPLHFCMAAAANITCANSPIGVRVAAGTTVTVTVADLGGVSNGVFLNAANEGLTVGTFTMSNPINLNAPCIASESVRPGCTGTVGNNKQFLFTNPGINVGIGTGNTLPAYPFTVSGNTGIYGDLSVSGNIVGNLNLVNALLINSADQTKLYLNSTSTSQKKSQISFRQNGTETWTIGTDNAANNTNNFYIYGGDNHNIPFYISPSGKIGIGTTNPSEDYAISINGNIRTKRVKVEVLNWSDFVFEKDYKLMSLTELEQYIAANKHLPEVPAASDLETNGGDVSELLKKQMQKIEELTLYIIQQQKELDELKKKVK